MSNKVPTREAASFDKRRVLGRLCHLIALSRKDQLGPAVDRLVLAALTEGADNIAGPDQLVNKLKATYGVSAAPGLIQSSLDRLLNRGQLLREPNSRTLVLSVAARASIGVELAESEELEEKVRVEWLANLPEQLRPLDMLAAENLWKTVVVYLGKTYLRHGAETALLINPALNVAEPIGHSLSSYLAEAIAECCPGADLERIQEAVANFFRDPTPARNRYIAGLLDGGFTLYALTSDKATTEYLTGQLRTTEIFLDTNFIFALLGIGNTSMVSLADDVVGLIQSNSLPLRLYYHEKTLEELKRLIYAIGDRLRGRRWQQSVSRAASKDPNVNGLELMYHRANAEAPLDPSVFLAKYEHVEELLDERGLRKYVDGPRVDEAGETLEKGKLIAEYKEFLEQNRPRGSKPYEALDHDIAVFRTIQKLRGAATSILNAKAIFLSNDYFFYLFDLRRLRKPRTLGSVVMPNQLLQLLRPFIPPSEDSDKRFVEAFTLPLLRTSAADYGEATSAVLQILNNYADISEDTALKILADEYLSKKLRNLDIKSPQFAAEVDGRLAKDLQTLASAHDQLVGEVGEIKESLRDRDQQLARSQEETRKAQADAESGRAREFLLQGEIDRTRREKDDAIRSHRNAAERRQRDVRLVAGLSVALVGVLLIVLLPVAVQMHHKALAGLQVEGSLFFVGCGWAVADRANWRLVLIGVAAVAAAAIGTLVVLQ